MQDVGLMREVKAMKKPGCPVCGPRGVAYDQGEQYIGIHPAGLLHRLWRQPDSDS